MLPVYTFCMLYTIVSYHPEISTVVYFAWNMFYTLFFIFAEKNLGTLI